MILKRNAYAAILGILFVLPFSQAKPIEKAKNLWIAEADMMNVHGEKVGTAKFTQAQRGVVMELVISGLEPGEYGIHFHEFGKCDGPSFTSAGNHFNPDDKEHGLKNEKGSHAGDLPNLKITTKKDNKVELSSDRVSLEGGKNSLLRDGGTTVVIHAEKDDQQSNPSGKSGARIVCGVIQKISPMDIKDAKTVTIENKQ